MIANLKDKFAWWLAYRLPRSVARYAAVRVIAHASIINSTKEMDALTPSDCLAAWSKK